MTIGLALFAVGFLIGARFLYYFLTGDPYGRVQSLILASMFLGIGFQTILVAFLSDLLCVNRKLIEEIQYKLRERQNNK
jgi:hypothetical protein